VRRCNVNLWLVLIVVLVVSVLASGCRSNKPPPMPTGAGIPSGGAPLGAAYVANAQSAQVIMKASEMDRKLLATALESVQDSGAVAYVERQAVVRSPDGSVFTDPQGFPVTVTQTAVVKVNSLPHLMKLTKVGKVTFVMAGQAPIQLDQSTDELTMSMLEGVRFEIDGVEGAAIEGQLAQVVAARAAERGAIIQGWTKLVEAQWGGKIAWVGAVGDATALMTTSAGEQAVRIIKVLTPEGRIIDSLSLLVSKPNSETEEVTLPAE